MAARPPYPPPSAAAAARRPQAKAPASPNIVVTPAAPKPTSTVTITKNGSPPFIPGRRIPKHLKHGRTISAADLSHRSPRPTATAAAASGSLAPPSTHTTDANHDGGLRRRQTSLGAGSSPASRVILHEGVVYKKSPTGIRKFKKWQKRWFVLVKNSVLYFKNSNTQGTNQGIVPLIEMISVERHPKKPLRFDICIKGRVFALRTRTEQECLTWVAKIIAQAQAIGNHAIGERMSHRRSTVAPFSPVSGGSASAAGATPRGPESDEEEEERASIEVKIIGANKLKGSDRSKTTSNPYCILDVMFKDECVARFKTQTVSKTLSPSWNATFELTEKREIAELPEHMWAELSLHFEVLSHEGVGSDVFLGSANIKLGEVVMGEQKKPKQYYLGPRPEHRKKVTASENVPLKALPRKSVLFGGQPCAHGQIEVNICWKTDDFIEDSRFFQFGAEIEDIMADARWVCFNGGRLLPRVLVNLATSLRNLDGFTTEGIFRVAPSSGEADVVRRQINEWGRNVVEVEPVHGFTMGELSGPGDKYEATRVPFPTCTDVHIVAQLLKQWFRELPTGMPLDTIDMATIERGAASGPEAKKIAYNALSTMVPEPLITSVKYLFDVSANVLKNADQTRMSTEALAIVFAPNFRGDAPVDMMEFKKYNETIKEFLRNCLDAHYVEYKVRRARYEEAIRGGEKHPWTAVTGSPVILPLAASGTAPPPPPAPPAKANTMLNMAKRSAADADDDDDIPPSPTHFTRMETFQGGGAATAGLPSRLNAVMDQIQAERTRMKAGRAM